MGIDRKRVRELRSGSPVEPSSAVEVEKVGPRSMKPFRLIDEPSQAIVRFDQDPAVKRLKELRNRVKRLQSGKLGADDAWKIINRNLCYLRKAIRSPRRKGDRYVTIIGFKTDAQRLAIEIRLMISGDRATATKLGHPTDAPLNDRNIDPEVLPTTAGHAALCDGLVGIFGTLDEAANAAIDRYEELTAAGSDHPPSRWDRLIETLKEWE